METSSTQTEGTVILEAQMVTNKVSGTQRLCAKRKSNPRICCVLPAFNEAENLAVLIPVLCHQLALLSESYEILIVDDGSKDDSADRIIQMATNYPLRLLQLSRNFGKENALTAGIEYARGDLLILMDADFQHPVQLLPLFFAHWQKGYDMVYGVRTDRQDERRWKRYLSRWFYGFMARGTAAARIEPDAGDFRLLDRKVVEALQNLPERNRFMKGLYSWVGFKSIGIPFQVEHRRAGKSGFNFWRLTELAITGITSFTSLPLRFCSAFGALVSVFSIIYGTYIVIRTLLFGADLPGWATLVAGISFLSGIQLLSIGILGEYIARVFVEVKQRPTYVVGHYHESTILSKGEKINDPAIVSLRPDRCHGADSSLAGRCLAGAVRD